MKNWMYSGIMLVIGALFFSCSDAEIIAGTYHGKIYTTDTLNATAKIIKINDGYIRFEVTSPDMSETYVDYAQLIKNAPDAYNLRHSDDNGGFSFTGYYYEGYINVNSWANGYHFDGQKE